MNSIDQHVRSLDVLKIPLKEYEALLVLCPPKN